MKVKLFSPIFLVLIITGCAAQSESGSLPWWGWVLIIILLLLLFWLLFKTQPKKENGVDTKMVIDKEVSEQSLTEDFQLIEGIGPRINAILHEAEIHSFAQLAAMKPDEIMRILSSGGLRLADTTTWPEQARLAADGLFEELKVYQDTLKGGRVV